MLNIVNTILKMELGKTAKLILITMAANEEKNYWLIKEFLDYIGGDAKTVRFCINDLVNMSLVHKVGKTESQAIVYRINLVQIANHSGHDETSDDLIENELIRLSRQAQRHHRQHSNRAKQTKKS